MELIGNGKAARGLPVFLEGVGPSETAKPKRRQNHNPHAKKAQTQTSHKLQTSEAPQETLWLENLAYGDPTIESLEEAPKAMELETLKPEEFPSSTPQNCPNKP